MRNVLTDIKRLCNTEFHKHYLFVTPCLSFRLTLLSYNLQVLELIVNMKVKRKFIVISSHHLNIRPHRSYFLVAIFY